jgi:hypothetical protein
MSSTAADVTTSSRLRLSQHARWHTTQFVAHDSGTRVAAEPALRRWTRRSITITAFTASWALALVLCLPALALTITSDLSRGARNRWAHTRCVVFFVLYLTCEVAGTLAAFATWLWSGSWAGRSQEHLLRMDAALQRAWSSALFFGAVRIFSMKIQVEGTEWAASGPYLLFVRHASTADTVLAAALIANPNKILLRYVLKRELLWDPCLDIVGQRLPNAFVDRSGAPESRDIEAVRSLASGLGGRDGVLIFPEGTRFSQSKLERARERLRQSPEWYRRSLSFRHVLPPRIGGPLALLDAAPDIDAVFFAQSGFEGAVSFGHFWNGEIVGTTIRGRVWRVPASEIPRERDERIRWLFAHWIAVDDWIHEHVVDGPEKRERVGVASPRTV